MLRRIVCTAAAIAVSSCQQAHNDNASQIEKLNAQVSALEDRQRIFDDRLARDERLIGKASMTAAQDPPKMMTYELEGIPGDHQYSTEARCEAARQALFTPRPTLSCLPL